MLNSVRDGKMIDLIPTEDITGGTLLVLPNIVAVAATDIKAGELGAAQTEGVFRLPKDAGEIAQGAAVYVETSGDPVSATGDEEAGAIRAGVAWSAAAAGDAFAIIKINA